MTEQIWTDGRIWQRMEELSRTYKEEVNTAIELGMHMGSQLATEVRDDLRFQLVNALRDVATLDQRRSELDDEITELRKQLAQSWQPLVEETVQLDIGTVEVAGATLVILNNDGSYKADVIMDDAHAFCRRAAPDPLAKIVEAIRRERAYQDAKWGTIEENPHHIYQWAELLYEEVREAMAARHSDNRETLREVLQVVAVGVACLQQHGVVER